MIDSELAPQAIDVEQQILGAMLLSGSALAIGLDQLTPESFYDRSHGFVFVAMANLFERNIAADLVTLTEELRRTGRIDEVGGPAYLATLATETATTANIRAHIRIVQDRWVRRSLQTQGHLLHTHAADLTKEVSDLIAATEQGITNLVAGNVDGLVPITDILPEVLQEVENAHRNPDLVPGYHTGIQSLDDRLGRLQPSELILLAARPSVGKTALAVQIALNVASSHKEQGQVAIFSVEMPRKAILLRSLSHLAKIEFTRLRDGKLQEEDWMPLTKAMGKLNMLPIHIDDTGGISILEARARLRLLAKKHPISLVVVDYIQLMSGRGDNREQEISSISRGLKALAKEVNAPVLALSQMNRDFDKRAVKIPQLSDLRESGSLEQDADAVVFLSDTQGEDSAEIEVNIAKSRNGPKGTFPLHYERRFFTFADMAEEWRMEPPTPRRGAIAHWQERDAL